LANGAQIWRTAHSFSKRGTDFSLLIQHNGLANFVKVQGKKLEKLNGKFFAKRCAPGTFCLAHKRW